MHKIVSVRPSECSACHSSCIVAVATAQGEKEAYVCADCGLFFSVLLPEEEAAFDDLEGLKEENNVSISADLKVCPHCFVADTLVVQEGHEWCKNCQLDPNLSLFDYEQGEIAHLWKLNSQIQNRLLADSPALRATSALGSFLRRYCGPACDLAEVCPQSASNLRTCYEEIMGFNKKESEEQDGQREHVGRKRKKKRGFGRRQRKNQAVFENQSAVGLKTHVQYSSEGWFKETYGSSTHRQNTSTKGS